MLLALLTLSGRDPYDRLSCFKEVAPIPIAVPVLPVTWRRVPLTSLLHALLFVHAVVLIMGAAHTLARVPPGYWLQDVLELARIPCDKMGHRPQGFVPGLASTALLLLGPNLRPATACH